MPGYSFREKLANGRNKSWITYTPPTPPPPPPLGDGYYTFGVGDEVDIIRYDAVMVDYIQDDSDFSLVVDFMPKIPASEDFGTWYDWGELVLLSDTDGNWDVYLDPIDFQTDVVDGEWNRVIMTYSSSEGFTDVWIKNSLHPTFTKVMDSQQIFNLMEPKTLSIGSSGFSLYEQVDVSLDYVFSYGWKDPVTKLRQYGCYISMKDWKLYSKKLTPEEIALIEIDEHIEDNLEVWYKMNEARPTSLTRPQIGYCIDYYGNERDASIYTGSKYSVRQSDFFNSDTEDPYEQDLDYECELIPITDSISLTRTSQYVFSSTPTIEMTRNFWRWSNWNLAQGCNVATRFDLNNGAYLEDDDKFYGTDWPVNTISNSFNGWYPHSKTFDVEGEMDDWFGIVYGDLTDNVYSLGYTFYDVEIDNYKFILVPLNINTWDNPVSLPLATGSGLYSAIDTNSDPQAIYNWVEISSIGTVVTFNDNDDGYSSQLPIGFSFPFYGSNYNNVVVSTNGYLQFGTVTDSYMGPRQMSDSPFNIIAVLWDDFVTDGNVYYYFDSGNDRFIVQWDGVYKSTYEDTSYTFEVMIYSNGNIIMQYKNISNAWLPYPEPDHYYQGSLIGSTGIQQISKLDGLDLVSYYYTDKQYDQYSWYYENELAINIVRND